MKNIYILVASLTLLLFTAFHMSGCQATYPKEKLADSVIDLCKKEYDVDVKVHLVGRTLAIYIPLVGLLDVSFSITEEARDKIMDVILSVSRVALSTDADIQFYCVIAQDIRLPEIQIIIIKYTEDVKRAYYMDISRGEYFKRMLIDIVANPQAKKEESIRKVFQKFNLDKAWQDEILNDFFRTTPIYIKDMGYWQDRFYIKDITLDEFLAEQMAYRIRMRFREDKKLYDSFLLGPVNSVYEDREGVTFFDLEFEIKPKKTVPGDGDPKNVIFTNVLNEVTDTVYGYKFDRFDFVEMLNRSDNLKLIISREDLYAYQKKRLPLGTILTTVH